MNHRSSSSSRSSSKNNNIFRILSKTLNLNKMSNHGSYICLSSESKVPYLINLVFSSKLSHVSIRRAIGEKRFVSIPKGGLVFTSTKHSIQINSLIVFFRAHEINSISISLLARQLIIALTASL